MIYKSISAGILISLAGAVNMSIGGGALGAILFSGGLLLICFN